MIPQFSEAFIKEKLQEFHSSDQQKLNEQYYNLWLMYNGQIRDIIEVAIKKEFKRPDTISDLVNRIIPINFISKIVTKLATVFTEAPLRSPAIEDEAHQKQLDTLVQVTMLNLSQREANAYFKLFKCNLKEIYLDSEGYPSVRNLPRHTYKVWSHDLNQPNIVDTVMIVLKSHSEKEKQVYSWWTANENWITNGKGMKLPEYMKDNPDGLNPYGALPFTYLNTQTLSVDPIFSDDLYRMQIILPLILSDIAFAIKYYSWSSIVVTGDQQGDFPFSPNSIISLPYGPQGETPKVDVVRPEVNIEGVLRFIEFNVAFLLSSMNLSSKTIQGKLESSSMASGVAKMLDESESIEDKKGQQAYFRLEEKDFWWKLTKYMMPFWRANRMLNPEVDFEFSPDFEILIQFRDPKVMMTEEQQLEVSKKRIDYGFSTLRRELDKLYPEMKDTEIDALVIEIKSERTEYYAAQVNPEAALEEAEDEESSERKHSHEGTGLAFSSSGGHYHEMSDGSGDTSITEDESPQHIHVKPDGKNTSLPRYL